jgi:hypothetical protein
VTGIKVGVPPWGRQAPQAPQQQAGMAASHMCGVRSCALWLRHMRLVVAPVEGISACSPGRGAAAHTSTHATPTPPRAKLNYMHSVGCLRRLWRAASGSQHLPLIHTPLLPPPPPPGGARRRCWGGEQIKDCCWDCLLLV